MFDGVLRSAILELVGYEYPRSEICVLSSIILDSSS